MFLNRALIFGCALTLILLRTDTVVSQTIMSPFDTDYSVSDLGSIPGVPGNYGGLTLQFGDPDTLLIGGAANTESGEIFEIGVARDAENHITGFVGSATRYGEGAYNDGGLQFGPDGVLFLARWPNNELGQNKAGSTVTDKVVDLGALGVGGGGPGGLSFVPPGIPGEGQLKIVTWSVGEWYTLGLAPDGMGTFDVTSATLVTTLGGGPEGIAYVPIGSAQFDAPSVLVSEYSDDMVSVYEVDANGDPELATRRTFITGLTGAEGAFIDPLTGDFLFSTFGGGDRVVVVSGFVPEPASQILSLVCLAGMVIFKRHARG